MNVLLGFATVDMKILLGFGTVDVDVLLGLAAVDMKILLGFRAIHVDVRIGFTAVDVSIHLGLSTNLSSRTFYYIRKRKIATTLNTVSNTSQTVVLNVPGVAEAAVARMLARTTAENFMAMMMEGSRSVKCEACVVCDEGGWAGWVT